jgi:hypothetical protein
VVAVWINVVTARATERRPYPLRPRVRVRRIVITSPATSPMPEPERNARAPRVTRTNADELGETDASVEAMRRSIPF